MRNLNNRTKHPATAITTPEAALRRVLERLLVGEEVAGTADWEIVGQHLLALAERDALDWPAHAGEFVGAYAAEVVALLRRRPDALSSAQKPWGVAVARGRVAGRNAVGLEALVGLTARDAITHRLRLSSVPSVVSLESIVELDD